MVVNRAHIIILFCATLWLPLDSCRKDDPTPVPNAPTAFPEIADLIFYEVNLRAFSANGDLEGVEQKLDHIAALGVNAI